MRIVSPGPLTTIQDLGRPGYQRYGVAPGGAMDRVALRLANALVGNDPDEAALEITLAGPTIEFTEDRVISLCGPGVPAEVSGIAVPGWCAIRIEAGARLQVGSMATGCRSYLAVAGGFTVETVMGSRATYLRAALGGMEGRPLRSGDVLPVGSGTHPLRHIGGPTASLGPVPFAVSTRRVAPGPLRPLYGDGPMRATPGAEADLFTSAERDSFFSEAFTISTESDRMGCRLDGPRLEAGERAEIPSRPVATGSIQVPRGGRPIVLMADRQTTGGYPVIADVITADLHRLAQLRPGDALRFEEVTVEDAQRALRELEGALHEILKELPDASE